ncbi:hypothetical protein [Ruminococcus sp.]|uniref:hypothetical protein n=1 Tax=Ruminococcus sp. TaxID=41978 RepID=UPI0025EF9290|nr:hypothetical protein [Ruminococcus sp.]MBQ8966854.1 hypothetical protein [Ruminococcus sp.]
MDENFPYKDIIDLPHHQSAGRKHMSLYDRAAQFAPFAALTGYDDIIAETGRLTDDMLDLPDDVKDELDRRFVLLNSLIDEGYRPEVTVTYFVPDKTKEGGSFERYTSEVKRIDSTMRTFIFYDKDKELSGKVIDIGAIVAVEGEFIDEMI